MCLLLLRFNSFRSDINLDLCCLQCKWVLKWLKGLLIGWSFRLNSSLSVLEIKLKFQIFSTPSLQLMFQLSAHTWTDTWTCFILSIWISVLALLDSISAATSFGVSNVSRFSSSFFLVGFLSNFYFHEQCIPEASSCVIVYWLWPESKTWKQLNYSMLFPRFHILRCIKYDLNAKGIFFAQGGNMLLFTCF